MTSEPRAIHEFFRLVMGSIIGAVVLGAVGAWPTSRLAGTAGMISMAAGIGISVVASVVGAIPISMSRDPSPASRQVAFLGAIAARMFTTLALFAAMALAHVVDNTTLAIWTGVSYLVLLAIETFIAIRLTQQRMVNR